MGDEINQIVARVGRHFGDLLNKDANPLETALALMDKSSIGKAMYFEEFEQLQAELNSCLKQQVVSNYDGFNSSVSVYHTLVNTVNDNHQEVQMIQEELQRIRQLIKDRRPIVKEWQESSLKYKKDLEILDTAERLKNVPDKFEELVSRKRFLEAHQCLNDAMETIVSKNMSQYTPINPIYKYISQQQLGLAQLMEQEISAHLYLKSPWTASRWAYHSPSHDSQDLIQNRISHETATVESAKNLEMFLRKLKDPLEIDHSTSVESDSFTYIRLLVEILGKIGPLDKVPESILAKVQVDIRRLVEKTISDFIKEEKISVESLSGLPTDLVSLMESTEYKKRLRVLEALASTIYSKLNAVLQGHRVFYELVKDQYQYNILHVYSAIENEVSSLLSSYIDAPIRGLRRKSFGSESRRSAPSKHFAKSEIAAPSFIYSPDTMDPEIQTQFDDLRLAMKKWVPGLELTAELDNGQFNPFADTHKESNLGVVAPSNILNIRALASPTAAFLQCARETLAHEEQCVKRIDAFLSNLLNNTYLPTLKNTVERQVDEILEEDDTAVSAQFSYESRLPILDSAYKPVDLIAKLTRLLNTNTYYRANYVDILIMVVEMLRDHFGSKIEDGLRSSGGNGTNNGEVGGGSKYVKAIQQLVKNDEYRKLHKRLHSDQSIIHQELQFYLKKAASPTSQYRLTLNDILDISTFKLFTLLSTTIQWVLIKLKKFMKMKEQVNEGTPLIDSQVTYVRRWWALVDLGGEVEADADVRILLAGESIERFNSALKKMTDYNEQILSLLRADLMCRIVYHFDEMATKGRFDMVSEADHHDPDIELLQNNLANCHKLCAKNLLPADRSFVFAGCAKLMNELFIHESKNIKGTINENGIRKMFSNILSLQQVLKSVVREPKEVDFLRSVGFYEALLVTSARALDGLKNGKNRLTEEDMVLLLQLKQKEDLAKSRDHTVVQAQFNEQMQQVRLFFAKNAKNSKR